MTENKDTQVRAIIHSFAMDTPWKGIDLDLKPFLSLPPKERGRRFAAFLLNDCREVIAAPAWAPKAARAAPAKLILEHVSTTIIPATTRLFVAKANFAPVSRVKLQVLVMENFWNWFLAGEAKGKIEMPITEARICGYQVRQNSSNSKIIEAMGGQEQAETTLTEIDAMIAKQPRGEKGALRVTERRANVFYVRDKDGVLRAVRVRRLGRSGWDFFAFRIDSNIKWTAGDRVFFRKPSPTSPIPDSAAVG